ncbi:hypothetical protein ACSSV1_004883 [Labrenzia sp. MBR-25]
MTRKGKFSFGFTVGFLLACALIIGGLSTSPAYMRLAAQESSKARKSGESVTITIVCKPRPGERFRCMPQEER